MNITEASKRLGVTEDYLRKLYKEDRIEAYEEKGEIIYKDYPQMVSAQNIADDVGLTVARINKLCLMGAIQYCWIGRYVRITKKEAEKFKRRYNV